VVLSAFDIAIILAAGFAAGLVNAIVGSGSLITFPVLLAVGYAPVAANVSNTVGMVFGNVSGVIGYRRELAGQRRRVIVYAIPSAAGGLIGGILLLALPQTVFHRVVPVLVLLAVVLVIVQPRLSTFASRRLEGGRTSWVLGVVSVFLTAIYGGYFGAAQGVILMGLLPLFLNDDLQRLNALKNVIAAIVNGVAAVLFALVAQVAWPAAGLLAVSSVAGGQVGAAVGRRLPPNVLRAAIVIGGLAAVAKLVTS
jgi:uncharacterized membrane protein YfcA